MRGRGKTRNAAGEVGWDPRGGDDRDLLVGGYFSGAVRDGDGHVYGSPPLHMHHNHLHENNFDRPRKRLFGQWHADAECPEEAGGTACQLSEVPGVFRVRGTMTWSFEFNDIRPAGSPPLRW
eukprot:gene8888-17437_t